MYSVFITGADRNIGLELCRDFLARGWMVFAGRYAMNLTFLDSLQKDYPETLVILSADTGSRLSLENAAILMSERVDRLDMFVHNAAHFGGDMGDIRAELDLSKCWVPFNINALGAIRLANIFLPLMRTGLKRLCFISSEAGSVSVATRNYLSSYCMSKTALNMAVRLMFNELQPMGHTFRLFHPGWVRSPEDGVSPAEGKHDPPVAAKAAAEQFIQDRDWEDRLAIVDYAGAIWPF
jgi:NAD(P)-dependent dehydrogenase (short-subunit alcohol dehydrogenase family)